MTTTIPLVPLIESKPCEDIGTDNGLCIINANNKSNGSTGSASMNARLDQSTAIAAASPGVVGVMELGDDFRAEVEQEMLLMSSPQSMNTNSNSSSQGHAVAREEVDGHRRSRLVVNMHARRGDDDMDPKSTTTIQSEDVNVIPPVSTTAIPPNTSSSSSSSLKNRMWGLVTDTAMVVADHVDKHKDR